MVIGVEELESNVSFKKSIFLYKEHFFSKNNIFIRVDRRVIGAKELESDVSF
jgi:hypothetical protein